MLLGVPVLKRYDLLERLLASAEAGSQKPTGYLIVDNGGQLDEGSAVIQRALQQAVVLVLSPGRNIGVAASWNAIIEMAGTTPVAISNDDVEFESTTFAEIERALNAMNPFIIADGGHDANGWCLFAQHQVLSQMIGPYDESFFPAYYEDSDYRWRMKLKGIEPTVVKIPFKHAVRGSWSDESRKHIRRGLEQFERKWGGDPRGNEAALFRKPFDGAPIAYSLRSNIPAGGWQWRKLERKIYRWDVINAVARKIGAKSYLEIGVGSGESMRHVEIPWKIGVDPAPADNCGADVFYRTTSDLFFSGSKMSQPFDIAFIDGLHLWEQAYRDIENACKIARVVVVHDANPSTEAMQRVPQAQGEWTGDVWKAIARIRGEGRHTACTVDTDYGVAVVIPNRRADETYGIATDDGARRPLPAETYDNLVAHRKELLGLISFDELLPWLEGKIK